MSWMAKLYETYEAGTALDLPDTEKPMPINHTLQNAHIKIVIDSNGIFKRAETLEKTQIVLPATEKSAGRSSGEAPHPLADKIQYIAKDYAHYNGTKKPYFEGYKKQLGDWCDSPFATSAAYAVYSYIQQGCVVHDLIEAQILYVDEKDHLLQKWPFEVNENNPIPPIFKILPKEKGKIEVGSALVCWAVEDRENLSSNTWTDPEVQQSWIKFNSTNAGNKGLCFASGEEQPLAVNHPAKLRHTGDKAKLISANDTSGFTFRGRLITGAQSVGIGQEITQKAHNALSWLIARQGYRNGDQVYIAWAVSGKKIPKPLMDPWAELNKEITIQKEIAQPTSQDKDHSVDVGEFFAHQFNKYLAGYRVELEATEQIIVMGLDSATPGRMGIIYYRELFASEFLDRLQSWHNEFAWPQRHIKEYPNPKNNKKMVRKTVWPVSSPVPRNIADAAYGDILKSNKTLAKNILERILPCIVDGSPFPEDILLAAVRRASNRNNCEKWEWERNLGIACALFKGFYLRHRVKQKRRNYTMALEEESNSRDYLYGRLLAIAEKIEEIALNVAGEKRPTNAARLMQRFADRPFSTWRNIELSLQPSIQRLQGQRAGFLTNRKKEMDQILALFSSDDFTSDKPLSGEFLLGFHCQIQYWRNLDTIKNDNKEGV